MSREIKFRAWDSYNKDMVFGAHLVDIINREIQNAVQEGIYPTDDLEYLQYTGLKDNNGKEIYEGDIVKVYNYKYDNENPELVEVTSPRQVKWMYNTPSLGHWSLVHLELYGLQYVGGFDKLEVIGNIYENPELLTAQQQ